MVQHGWDPLSNIGGDTGPCGTRPKRKRLLRAFAERCREQLQRLGVGIFHDLIPESIDQNFAERRGME